MKRKFITNLALLLTLNVLVKPFWIFGIDRTVQNIVGAAEYGFYFSLFSFSLLLNILLDLGITNFNNRDIARHPQLLSKYFSNIVSLKFLLGIFYAGISFLLAFLIGYNEAQLHLLWFLVINQFLASFLLYLRSNLSGLQMFKTDSILSVLDRIILIGICSILLWTNIFDNEFKIEWFVYAQTAAYSLSVIVAFLLVFIRTEFFQFKIDWHFMMVIIRKSYPYAILVILMSIYYRIDSVMLERMLPNGDIEAGIYAQAFRILDAFAMFAFLFATLLLPIFSRMIRRDQPVEELTSFSYMLLMIPVLIISISLIYYRHEFMDWLYHEHTSESARVLGVLMIAHIFVSSTYISGTLLTAGGHLRNLNIAAGAGLILNVLLNLVLIPKLAAYGSAIASLLTQILIMSVQLILVFRIFKFKNRISLYYRLILFIVLLIAITQASTYIHFYWLIKVIAVISLSGALAFVLGLIKLPILSTIIGSNSIDLPADEGE